MMTYWLESQEPWRAKRGFGADTTAIEPPSTTPSAPDPIANGSLPALMESSESTTSVQMVKDEDNDTPTSSTWLLAECHQKVQQPEVNVAADMKNEDDLPPCKDRECKIQMNSIRPECKACIVRDIRHNGTVNGLLSPRHRSPIISAYRETTPCL